VQHCCSWLGRCPQHQRSGGQGLSRRGRPGAPRVAVALRLAARTVPPARTALGACYRRLRRRLGAPQASTATAHKLARLVYSRLQHGSASVPQGLDAYESPYRARQVTALARQAPAVGYPLVALATPEVPHRNALAPPTP
jgi:hypothetical protein